MRKLVFLLAFLITVASAAALSTGGVEAQSSKITIRTENYPRPPYSGATYYIYERGGEVICTKLEVCNKYDDCSTEYKKGEYKDEIDVETGDPYGTTKPVVIAPSKLRKHVCLTKFKLIK